MTVEKRYSKRHSLDVDVYIRYRKQRAFPAKAANCSMQGMGLKTKGLTLLTGALVELEIFHAGRLWEVVGIVSHTQHDAIGVMFWYPQPELYASVTAGGLPAGGIARTPVTDVTEKHHAPLVSGGIWQTGGDR